MASPSRHRGWMALGLPLACGLLWACGGVAPEAPTLDRWRGENAVAEGRFDWARQYFARDVEQFPEHLPSLRQQGLSWLSGYQQSLSTGVELLQRYLERQGDDEEVEQRVVSTLLLLGDRDAARRWAEGLAPSAAGWRLRAEVDFEADPLAAVEAIEQALVQAPDDASVHATAARLYAQLEEGDKVLHHALRTVQLDPFNFSAFYLLGRWTQRAGDIESARRWLEVHQQVRRLQHDGTMSPLEPAAALELMHDLEPKLPAVPFAWRQRRLELLYQSGDLAVAQSLLDELASADEASVNDLVQMATWAGDAGRRNDARRLFDRVLGQQPDHPGALASSALLALEDGDLDAAAELLQRGLSARPHFARFHYVAGRLAIVKDRAATARTHLARALELAPWEWQWRITYCDLLRALGDLDTLADVMAAAPEDPPAWQAYGQQHGMR